jgi:hypothetical protein
VSHIASDNAQGSKMAADTSSAKSVSEPK